MFFFFFDSENYCVNDLIERMKTIKQLPQIIEETGIAQSTISAWKNRNTFPKCDDLYKIACCLNVTMEWLLTGKNESDKELPENEQSLLENYRSLDATGKHHVDLMIEALAGK